jgi:hypothetical protein
VFYTAVKPEYQSRQPRPYGMTRVHVSVFRLLTVANGFATCVWEDLQGSRRAR